MLTELAIKNFAIIDDLRISFSRGLSVLTGETGAGKSIIIEAVNLLLGGRAAVDLVRTGELQAELEAVFDIPGDSHAAKVMEEQGMEPGEGLIIRRIISTKGKHRIFINDRQSTMALLKQVTENLAGISSQHAHQRLLKEENHLEILDRFAGTMALRQSVKAIYEQLMPLVAKLQDLKENSRRFEEESELLEFQVREIREAEISPGEDRRLEEKRSRLRSGAEIFAAVNRAVDEIYLGDNAVIGRLGVIREELEKKGGLDASLAGMAEKTGRVLFELEDLADELRRYAEAMDLSPEFLEETEARLDIIQRLKRKYGGDLETLFARLESMEGRLAETGNIQARMEELEKKAGELSVLLGKKALALSRKRKDAALKLARLAEKELADLEMDQTRFVIKLSHRPVEPDGDDFFSCRGRRITASGMDHAAFLMSPNPGMEPRLLSRIASGGELSRVVLALNAILSDTESLGTLIFDEVDAGIGGKTSDRVGKKIQDLSRRYQVICITHLAQIARYGTGHFKIKKDVFMGRTSTTITPLNNGEERIQEIARMMGGETITKATLALAKELLAC